MLRKSTDDFMDVTMMPAAKGGEEADDDDASAASPPPPPIKEVNNNVLGVRDSAMGAEGGGAASPRPPTSSVTEMEKSETAAAAAAATVYSCGSLRLSVTAGATPTATAQWLCVARLPRDFTRAELIELVEEYGPVEETHMIHSEKTGRHTHRQALWVRGCVNSPLGQDARHQATDVSRNKVDTDEDSLTKNCRIIPNGVVWRAPGDLN